MLITFRRFLIAAALLGAGLLAIDPAAAVDDLPSPAATEPTGKEFPLTVTLLGYVRNNDTMSALVEIDGKTKIVTKGIETEVSFFDVLDVTHLVFLEFDERKRELRLGFPRSPYLPKDCGMKRPVGQESP